jgi:hypothetical protein
MVNKIVEALRERFQTRDIAKTPQGRFNELVRAETGKDGRPNTKAIAERLGVSQRQVQRYIKTKGQIAKADPQTLERLETEVRKDHQPRIMARAQREAEQRGLGVETRARFGYHTSSAGTTDQARLRRLTENVPSHLIPDIFEALRNSDEERLRELVAEGLAEEYFRTPGGGAADIDVTFSEIDYIEFWGAES